jgi:hypothetical protein
MLNLCSPDALRTGGVGVVLPLLSSILPEEESFDI